MADFTFEEMQEIRAHVAEKAQEKFRRYVDIAERYLAHLIARRYFWDEPPAVRFAHYIMSPPLLPDGTPTPAGETGEWDYAGLAAEMPWLYERFLADWAGMVREGIRKG